MWNTYQSCPTSKKLIHHPFQESLMFLLEKNNNFDTDMNTLGHTNINNFVCQREKNIG